MYGIATAYLDSGMAHSATKKSAVVLQTESSAVRQLRTIPIQPVPASQIQSMLRVNV